jgi:molecular chaperone DnaK
MDNNGKINRGIDLGTTNSAVAVMENGVVVIMKSPTQKDTVPSVISITRKGVIHTGDTAANELANQVLRATKTWDGRYSSTDAFKEFKRTMGTLELYHSKNLKKDFTSQQLSAEIIKTLAANAGINDGGSIVISVPAKFDATQKTATVEAARLAGFQHVELLQEPIAAAIAFGVATGQQDGFWLVFDLGGGTFDVALVRVNGGVQQVVDTEGDSYLGGKDIDYAFVDNIFLPYVKKKYKLAKILASEKKAAMLREALKVYAENAKVALSSAPTAEVLSDLGDLGFDDNDKEIELDLTITREMAHPIMEPFFMKTVTICQKLLKRNHLDGSQLSKLILVGGPTYSPYLRQMLKDEVTLNVDSSVDPMTAVAKGAALYASTRDIPKELKAVLDADAVELELHYDSMAVGRTAFLAIKVKSQKAVTGGMTVEVVRNDNAWRSGHYPYEEGGVVIELVLAEHAANNFNVYVQDGFGRSVKVSPDNLTILQGMHVLAAPLSYHIGFGMWNMDQERQEFVPFIGLEKNKPVPAQGVAHGRKTTMRIVPGDESSCLRIPVYQAASYVANSPASLYEHVADVLFTGKDVTKEIPAGSEVDVQVSVDSSEMMTFTVALLSTDEEIVKHLDTSPRFNTQDSERLIEGYADSARHMLDMLASEEIGVGMLKNRLYTLKSSRQYTEKKAIIELYRELLHDIYSLECKTAWERIIRKVDSEMILLSDLEKAHGNDFSHMAMVNLRENIASAKAIQNVDGAKRILHEIGMLRASLTWETGVPHDIRWYDRNFDNVCWYDKDDARECVDEAIKVLGRKYTREELLDAYQKIINAENRNEIREADGLLG